MLFSRRFSFRRVTFLALSKRLLTAALFALTGWWELKCRYLSVCIGFLKTVTSRVPPSHLSHAYKNTSIFAPRFTFALRITRASNRNVGKFYRTIKLSAKNLRLFHADSNCHFISRSGNFCADDNRQQINRLLYPLLRMCARGNNRRVIAAIM